MKPKFVTILVLAAAFLMLVGLEDTQAKPKKEHEFIQRITRILSPIQYDNIPPRSIIIAQAILESGWGESELSTSASNYFGIKGEYKGEFVVVPTQEFLDNTWISVDEKFRKYPDLATSIEDYLDLMTLPRYQKVKDASNYKEAAVNLVTAGYATDPNYSEKLITLIETYELHQYDR